VEIQTDKINVEIPSPAEGTLSSISVAEGTTVLVGTEIGQIAAMGEATAAPVAAAAAKAAAAVTTQAPARAAAPVPAAASVPVAASAPAPAYAAAPGGNGPNGNAQTIESGEGRNLSPAVRKIMREQNVSMTELGAIAGSGVAGRITRDDLLDYLKRRGAGLAPSLSAPAVAAALVPPARRARRRRGRPARDHDPVYAGAQGHRREHGQGQAHGRAHALLRRVRHEQDRGAA